MTGDGPAPAARPESPGARYQHLLAPHLRELGPEATRRVSEILAFTDFAAALTRPRRAEEVASLILLVSLGETGARWTGLLFPDGNGAFRPSGRRGAADPGWSRVSFPAPEVLPDAAVIRTGDCASDPTDPEAPFCRLMEEVAAVAAAPLRFGDRLLGVLLVGPATRTWPGRRATSWRRWRPPPAPPSKGAAATRNCGPRTAASR